MARKISIVTDARLVVQQPETPREIHPHPTYLPPQPEEEIDYELIEQREAEIDELMTEFICGLVGADDPEEKDLLGFALQDELEALKDEFEDVLANHGITIHRPTIVEDSNGNEVIVNSLYEVSE